VCERDGDQWNSTAAKAFGCHVENDMQGSAHIYMQSCSTPGDCSNMGKERERESVLFASPRAVYVLTCTLRDVCKTVYPRMIFRAFEVAGSNVD
jgi:hypothetical protein